MSLSLVRPSGCSHVKVAWGNGLDGFCGIWFTDEVDEGRMGEAVDAFGLLVGIGPALAGLIEIVKGPMTGLDATQEDLANG